MNVSNISSVDDARYYAKRRLPRFLFQRYEAGSGIGTTVRANTQAFEEVTFRPRAATYFPQRSLGTRVLGLDIALPIMLAPVGILRAGHVDGELGVARAAGAAGTIQFVSGVAGSSIEEITAAASGPIFYQLYYMGGRASAEGMIDRARNAGCKALVITIDAQAGPSRERIVIERAYSPRSLRAGELLRVLPQVISKPTWLMDFLLSRRGLVVPMAPLRDGKPLTIFELGPALFQRTPTWDDIPWIRSLWKGPLVIKGVLTVDDARRAVASGADAIVVSNHGGNGLDGSPATLRVLPSVVAAVGSQTEVWMDGGVRRGSDVAKAVALGAKAVLIGRAYVYGLMAAGQPGVGRILELMRNGLDETLSFLGCPSVEKLDPTFVELPPTWR